MSLEWNSRHLFPIISSFCWKGGWPGRLETIIAFNSLAVEYNKPRPSTTFVLPPEQAAELLPWYMQWSWDLVAEMHRRRLVWNEAHHTVPPSISYRLCDCTSEWRCEPHDACFIHDSCFCPSSGSFPPVKPPRS